jgi:hypothetical protein
LWTPRLRLSLAASACSPGHFRPNALTPSSADTLPRCPYRAPNRADNRYIACTFGCQRGKFCTDIEIISLDRASSSSRPSLVEETPLRAVNNADRSRHFLIHSHRTAEHISKAGNDHTSRAVSSVRSATVAADILNARTQFNPLRNHAKYSTFIYDAPDMASLCGNNRNLKSPSTVPRSKTSQRPISSVKSRARRDKANLIHDLTAEDRITHQRLNGEDWLLFISTHQPQQDGNRHHLRGFPFGQPVTYSFTLLKLLKREQNLRVTVNECGWQVKTQFRPTAQTELRSQ